MESAVARQRRCTRERLAAHVSENTRLNSNLRMQLVRVKQVQKHKEERGRLFIGLSSQSRNVWFSAWLEFTLPRFPPSSIGRRDAFRFVLGMGLGILTAWSC